MMKIPAVLQENAYNVVGLPSGSSLQTVKKRTIHLISLAKIDESEVFASDLGDVSILRTEMVLRRALEKLTSVKNRLEANFFWFEFLTVFDEEIYKDVIAGNFQSAINKWSIPDSQTSWLSKKNLGLVLFLEAFATKSFSAYQKCIETWLEIYKSDSFWQFYGQFYKSNDDLGTDSSIFAEFRKDLPLRISRYAEDSYHELQDPKVIAHFFKIFKVIGPDLEQSILNPVIRSVYEVSSRISGERYLEKLPPYGYLPLEDLLKRIATLNSFGLDEYTPVKNAKEKCAEQLRTAAIYFNNKYSNPASGRDILEAALLISNTESLNVKIKQDLDILVENIQQRDKANIAIIKSSSSAEKIADEEIEEERDPEEVKDVLLVRPISKFIRTFWKTRVLTAIIRSKMKFEVKPISLPEINILDCLEYCALDFTHHAVCAHLKMARKRCFEYRNHSLIMGTFLELFFILEEKTSQQGVELKKVPWEYRDFLLPLIQDSYKNEMDFLAYEELFCEKRLYENLGLYGEIPEDLIREMALIEIEIKNKINELIKLSIEDLEKMRDEQSSETRKPQ